jgi:CheY-like chemotaxis protein
MGMRILVVDDYPSTAEVACLYLQGLGHECRAAGTAAEALEVAAAFDPEIVILDIGLPDQSGYEVARTLRARAGGRRLHLAAVTGWGAPHDRVRAFEAGFDQHILKPADGPKLRSIIAAALIVAASDPT